MKIQAGLVLIIAILSAHPLEAYGDTVFEAVNSDDTNFLSLYLSLGGNLNVRDNPKTRQTPLILAVRCKSDACVKLLIDGGADVNARDSSNVTALMYAARFNPDDVRLLLKAGANPEAKDYLGRTALMYAADAASIRLLIDAGSKVKETDVYRKTVLMYALDNLKIDLFSDNLPDGMKLLIDAGADIDAADSNGKSVFQLAMDRGYPKLGTLLRQLGNR